MVCSVCARAYSPLTPETVHFVAIHGDLGYAGLLHTMQGRKPSSGVNTNVGVDYRLYHNNFLFSAGVEGMYALYANKMDKLDVELPMIDTEGDLFNMHVHVDESRDVAHMVNVNIPLLFGGEWERFYFMVGPKLSLNMYGATASNAKVTTYGEYEQYYDDFYDMTNHQFISGQRMSSETLKMKWNFNIMAHAEIGARIGHMFKHKQFRTNPDKIRMYIAVYTDFGILNIHADAGGKPIFDYRETENGLQFYSQPLMMSNLADNEIFRNLHVGIKFTVAFELPKHGKSYVYQHNRVGRNYRKRGGNQTIIQ